MGNDAATLQGADALTESVPVGAFEQLFYYFQDGGPVLYVLLAISILGLTVILAKLYQFTTASVRSRGTVKKIGNVFEAGCMHLCTRESAPSPRGYPSLRSWVPWYAT